MPLPSYVSGGNDSDLLRGERILVSCALTDGKLWSELSGLDHVEKRNELSSLLL